MGIYNSAFEPGDKNRWPLEVLSSSVLQWKKMFQILIQTQPARAVWDVHMKSGQTLTHPGSASPKGCSMLWAKPACTWLIPNGFCLLNHPLSQPTRNRITSELHLSHMDIFRNITVACPVLKHSRKGCSFFSHLEFSQDKLLLIIPIHTPETQHRDEQEKQTDTMNPKNLCPHVLQLSPPFPFSSSPPLRALVLL